MRHAVTSTPPPRHRPRVVLALPLALPLVPSLALLLGLSSCRHGPVRVTAAFQVAPTASGESRVVLHLRPSARVAGLPRRSDLWVGPDLDECSLRADSDLVVLDCRRRQFTLALTGDTLVLSVADHRDSSEERWRRALPPGSSVMSGGQVTMRLLDIRDSVSRQVKFQVDANVPAEGLPIAEFFDVDGDCRKGEVRPPVVARLDCGRTSWLVLQEGREAILRYVGGDRRPVEKKRVRMPPGSTLINNGARSIEFESGGDL